MSTTDDPIALLSALVLEDGRLWGEVAVPFQRDDARAIFDPDGPPWHFLTRPRGGSKSTDLAAVLLVWLVTMAAPGEKGYIAAADKDQSKFAVLDALTGLVNRTPTLRSFVTIQSDKVVAKSGATIEVLAADSASAHGLRPSFVVVDEVAVWADTRNAKRMWAALVSALAKVPGCRFVVLTSAGEPDHWSFKVLKGARKSKHWHVNEVPGPLPWVDPADLEAQRPLLLDSVFSQYHLNLWVENEDRLVSEADLQAAAALDGPLQPVRGQKYLVSCDLGLVNDASVGIVAHAEFDPDQRGAPRLIVVDRIARWQGSKRRPVSITESVEPWLLERSREFNNARVVIDSWQAAGLVERLQAALGQEKAEEIKLSEPVVGRIGTSLHLAFREHRIHIPNDEELLSELRTVRLRKTNLGDFRIDHLSGKHDDQAMSLGLAVVELAGPVQRSGAMPVFFSKKDEARERVIDARRDGLIPEAVAVIPGRPYGGDTSTGLEREDGDDQTNNGRLAPSPFV